MPTAPRWLCTYSFSRARTNPASCAFVDPVGLLGNCRYKYEMTKVEDAWEILTSVSGTGGGGAGAVVAARVRTSTAS